VACQLGDLIHLHGNKASFGDVLSETFEPQLKFGCLDIGLLNLNCLAVSGAQTGFNTVFIGVVRPEVSATPNFPCYFASQDDVEGWCCEYTVKRCEFLSQLVD